MTNDFAAKMAVVTRQPDHRPDRWRAGALRHADRARRGRRPPADARILEPDVRDPAPPAALHPRDAGRGCRQLGVRIRTRVISGPSVRVGGPFGRVAVADHPRRHAGGDREGRDLAPHDGAGGHDGAVPDPGPWQDDGAGPEQTSSPMITSASSMAWAVTGLPSLKR